MLRTKLLIPAVAIAAGLMLMESPAQAQVNVNLRFGPPVYRPLPPVYRPLPVYVAPVPYPVYRQAAPVIVVPHCQEFRVVYRECDHDQWQTFRVFHNHERAHEVVALLRQRGFEAFVDHN